MKFGRNGHNVLYLTQKPIEKVPFTTEYTTSNFVSDVDALRNITLRYCKTLPALLKTILEIHTWARCPRIIILESLHTYFLPTATESEEARMKSYTEFSENHALVVASLLNAVDSLFLRTKAHCFSIVSTDFNSSTHYEQFRQLFMDLYYSKPNCYFNEQDNNLKELEDFFDKFWN